MLPLLGVILSVEATALKARFGEMPRPWYTAGNSGMRPTGRP